MNLKKWNGLSPEIQKTLLDCSKETQDWHRREVERMDKECLELLKKHGAEVYVLPEKERARWKKASEPVMSLFLEKAGKEGKHLLDLAEKIR